MLKIVADSFNEKRVVILSIVSLLPPLILFFIITKYWVNVPFCDQWDVSIIFDKYFSHTLSFSDFIAQHNESRKLFPRLIILGSGLITGWDVRIEMCITIILACFISFNLFILLYRIEHLNIFNKLCLLLIVNLLLFSPVQWENWLMGIQMIFFIPALMLTTGLIVNTSNISIRKKVTCNSVLSIISTFSFANGMLVWFLLLPLNIFFKKRSGNKNESTKNIFYIFLYMVVAILIIGFYFMGYKKPSYHPSFLIVFSKPVDAILYFLNWIGSPFVPGNSSWGSELRYSIGLFIISIFLLSLAYCVFKNYKSGKLYTFYPWFILGLYSIISGVITTIGRMGFGISQATTSRYTTFSIFLPISLIVIVYLIYTLYIRNKLRITKLIAVAIVVNLSFFLTLYIHAFECSIKSIKGRNISLENGKLALQFYKIYQDNKKIENLYPNSQHVIDRFSKLTTNGLLDFKPVKPDVLKFLKSPSKTSGGSHGYLDKCQLNADTLIVKGWARHTEKKNPAQNVILIYTDKKGDNKTFAVLRVGTKRPDVAKAFKSSTMLNSGFSDIIDISHLPSGNLNISACVVNTDKNMAHQLANTYYIKIRHYQQ